MRKIESETGLSELLPRAIMLSLGFRILYSADIFSISDTNLSQIENMKTPIKKSLTLFLNALALYSVPRRSLKVFATSAAHFCTFGRGAVRTAVCLSVC